MIGWIIGGRVHWKTSARKVTHYENILIKSKNKNYGTCDYSEDANHVTSTLVQYNGTNKLKSMCF